MFFVVVFFSLFFFCVFLLLLLVIFLLSRIFLLVVFVGFVGLLGVDINICYGRGYVEKDGVNNVGWEVEEMEW